MVKQLLSIDDPDKRSAAIFQLYSDVPKISEMLESNPPEIFSREPSTPGPFVSTGDNGRRYLYQSVDELHTVFTELSEYAQTLSVQGLVYESGQYAGSKLAMYLSKSRMESMIGVARSNAIVQLWEAGKVYDRFRWMTIDVSCGAHHAGNSCGIDTLEFK